MYPLEPGLVGAFGLYLVRTGALVLGAPLLSNGSPFTGYRIATIGVLSVVLFLTTGVSIPAAIEPLVFFAMALRELLIGLFLAFILHAVALTVRVAGELVGQGMAFTMASQVDPATGVNTPLVTQIYENLFLLGLLVANGHHYLLRALSDSFERAPVGAIGVDLSLVDHVSAIFTQMFAAGLTFAGPIVVLLLLVSLVVGLLARTVPQINVLEMSFSLRILVGLGSLMLLTPLLEPATTGLYRLLAEHLDSLLDTLGA